MHCIITTEYSVVMKMFGVGRVLGLQFIAEITMFAVFYSKKALVSFVGIDTFPTSPAK